MRNEALAGGPGLEPGLTESESAVLPLNYPPAGPPQASAAGAQYLVQVMGAIQALLVATHLPLAPGCPMEIPFRTLAKAAMGTIRWEDARIG